ncbi:hypothetical protein ACFE04_019886 [Oxalis oulophora]
MPSQEAFTRNQYSERVNLFVKWLVVDGFSDSIPFTYRKQDASPLQCPKFGLGKRWRRSCNFLRIEHQASNMRTASTRRSTSKNTNAAFSPEISTSKRWNVMAEQRDSSNREWKISSSVVTSAEKHNKGSHSQAKRT